MPSVFQKFFCMCRCAGDVVTKKDLRETEKRIIESIKMTEQELNDGLDAITAQQGKIAAEQSAKSDALQAEIKRLQDLLSQGGTVTQATVDAFNRVKAASQALDDLIPDAPTP